MTHFAPNLTHWQRRHWVAAIVVLLSVTLTPLGWIQWRQANMLDDVSINQVDSIMWQAYQLERELSRLEQVLHEAEMSPAQMDPYDLQERYDIFLSRIDLLTKIPRRDLLEGTPSFRAATDALKAFTQLADPIFADPARIADQSGQFALLNARIDALLPQLSDLTQEANRAVARFVDERNIQLHQQSVLVITLAIVQSLGLLAFVALLIRHIRRQQKQYAQLQQLSQDLSEARDQAEAANRGKSIFLANMSHEIRTPFQGLLGMLNLLDEPNLSGRQRDYLQTARDSALHLLGVLNDILDVSTMESGTLKLSPAPVQLRQLVQEVDGLMQIAARDKGLDLHVYAAGDLPTWVMADATRLRQIMFNLINNAIKFTAEGSVLVELARQPATDSGIVLTVRDTGVGMDADTVSRLFTRFYQADNSLRRRIGGTGLGLEISRNLARMMDGDIVVSSQAGVGSVFTVKLDLPEAAAPDLDGSSSGSVVNERRLRILVAEDHPINLKYMSILLDRMGHDAVFCEDGQAALVLLNQQRFDVVLLDYHMPVLDGLATTETIRKLEGPGSAIKVILVTADVVNDTRKRAVEVGVNEFVSKPLQAIDLQQALGRCGLLDFANSEHNTGPSTRRLSAHSSLSSYEAPLRLTDAPVAQSQLIDIESYSEIVSMMPSASMEELLATLFDPPEGTLHVLLKALEEGDRESVTYNAHKLKGTAMLLGFRAIVKTSAQIEQLSSDATNPAMPRGLVDELLRAMESTQKALRRLELNKVV
jgi:two-component system, sensor histidine kinase